MVRNLLVILVAPLFTFTAILAFAQTKVDPFLDDLKSHTKAFKAAYLNNSAKQDQGEIDKVEVFIKTADPSITRRAIETAQGNVHTVAHQIMTATVVPSTIQEIAQGDEVIFIEAGKPIQVKNDVAGNEINSREVSLGTNLPAAYTGKGVIVGLIDTGIDIKHADFRDSNGKSRIISVWNQTQENGLSPTEINDSFGVECSAASIEDGSCPMRDFDGHGTHVAGILAGRHDTYGGVAPDANIVAVIYDSSLDLESGYANTIFSTKICQAAYYVFAKAEALGMPAVVNLSLGTHLGPHDGTSLFEECLAGLLKGTAGRAIVAAAGNEYSSDPVYTGIHAGFNINDTTNATNFVIRQLSRDRVYYIDIWGDRGSELSFGLAVRRGMPPATLEGKTDFIAPGSEASGSFLDGDVQWAINATETESQLNGKPHVGIRILLSEKVQVPSKLSFDLIVRGKGAFDAWLFPDKPSKTVQFTSISGKVATTEWAFIPGDRSKSISIPATSPDIIAVGGYTTRNRWESVTLPDCCQVAYELGDLLEFSSSGPSADPTITGQKPEITAPGGMIASALSSDSLPNEALLMEDSKHALQAGTSMAAPFVSGTAALMFSANPNFTYEDVKRYTIESAYVDEVVESVPNDRWGYGKLDVLAVVSNALKGGASGRFTPTNSLEPPPSPAINNGGDNSRGCTLIPGVLMTGQKWAPLMMVLMIFLSLSFLRRKKGISC